ncbi:MAG: flotillin-like protein FloA [Gemmatimonadota bacterium]
MNDMTAIWLIFAVFLGLLLISIIGWAVPLRLWVTALASGVHVPLGSLIGMRLRKVHPPSIILPLIAATKAELELTTDQLESHFLAGGDVGRVVTALISADKAEIMLPFKKAAAIDLAGRDVLEAVQVSVNPKVINTPKVAAMAKDGIQLIAVARVTVRANINRLVGGAGEDTILARVGEGIVSTIGSANSHKAVLENPDGISKTVLAKGLDADTAFEILSIDIADVDVGKNIGAELQTDQAEADKRIAQAKAEERRALAVAVEQENRAQVELARANVVQAEAEIPLAIAEAFRNGQLGIMDYMRFRNVEADTQMRQSIAKPETPRREGIE